jgi:hypothetical protein
VKRSRPTSTADAALPEHQRADNPLSLTFFQQAREARRSSLASMDPTTYGSIALADKHSGRDERLIGGYEPPHAWASIAFLVPLRYTSHSSSSLRTSQHTLNFPREQEPHAPPFRSLFMSHRPHSLWYTLHWCSSQRKWGSAFRTASWPPIPHVPKEGEDIAPSIMEEGSRAGVDEGSMYRGHAPRPQPGRRVRLTKAMVTRGTRFCWPLGSTRSSGRPRTAAPSSTSLATTGWRRKGRKRQKTSPMVGPLRKAMETTETVRTTVA